MAWMAEEIKTIKAMSYIATHKKVILTLSLFPQWVFLFVCFVLILVVFWLFVLVFLKIKHSFLSLCKGEQVQSKTLPLVEGKLENKENLCMSWLLSLRVVLPG